MVLIFSEYPRPIPSFRAPVPAPDVEPTDAPLVSVCFNYDWLPYVLGALTQLTLQSTWTAFDDPPNALAMRRGASLIEQFALAYDDLACPVEVPAPYWDDDEDVDDQLPDDVQPWYGYVTDPEAPPAELDFVENALIWAFTGFIAVATIEVGAAPAVLFRTLATKMVLANKRGDVGEVLRIFIDGEEAARVDTSGYAPGEIVRTPVVGDPSLDTHEIMIVQVS